MTLGNRQRLAAADRVHSVSSLEGEKELEVVKVTKMLGVGISRSLICTTLKTWNT